MQQACARLQRPRWRGSSRCDRLCCRRTPDPDAAVNADSVTRPGAAGTTRGSRPAALTRAGRFAVQEAKSSASPTSRRFPARRGAFTTRRGPIRASSPRARRPARRPPTPSSSSTARICRSGRTRARDRSSTRSGPSETAISRPAPGRGRSSRATSSATCSFTSNSRRRAPGEGASQDRGNSGVIFMGRYEVQVLDSVDNVTYADGQAAAIYGEYPPLVNAARRPGEWQTYDIIFEAPKFNGTTLVAPAYVTVIWNGVLVHHRRPIMGSTSATTTRARLHPARSRAAADAPGSLAPGALPERLDSQARGIRPAGSQVTRSRRSRWDSDRSRPSPSHSGHGCTILLRIA